MESTNEPQPMLLKPSEVARRLGISRTKVYDLINERRLPTVNLGPRCTRIPLSALEPWIAQQAAFNRH